MGREGPYSNYAGVHDSREVPIDVDNNGVLFLNSHVRLDDIIDGVTHTIFVAEKLTDATDLGWSSGTRSTLRNLGHAINGMGMPTGVSLPPGFAGGFTKASDMPSAGYGGEGYGVEATVEDLSVEPDEWETVRQKESQFAGSSRFKMLDIDPKSWLKISELPEVIPGKANDGLHVGGFGSMHTGGMNVLLGDGSVHFMSQNADRTVMQQLGNRADKTLMAFDPFW